MIPNKPERLFKEIILPGLCEGCGACAHFCPEKCINLAYANSKGLFQAGLSKKKSIRCNNCGICLQVCPALMKSHKKPSLPPTHREPQVYDWFAEPFQQVYLGFASDRHLRYQCSSGGLATSVLAALVSKKQVDGVILPCPDSNQPIRHRMALVHDVSRIVDNRGSVYCHVDISGIWRILEENTGIFAVVGLPCQLTAIQHVMRTRQLDASRLFKIGLFCGGTSSHRALTYLCRRKRIKPEKVTAIRYRSGGWPGRKIIVQYATDDSKTGSRWVVLLDRAASILQKNLYGYCFSGSHYPDFCLVCSDQTGAQADISLGDAWLPGITAVDHLGTNIVISRTDQGEAVIRKLYDSGKIEIRGTDSMDVIRSQGDCLVGKKLGVWGQHLQRWQTLDQETRFFKRTLPQYVPGPWRCIERRILRELARLKYPNAGFGCFLVFQIMVTLIMKMTRKVSQKTQKDLVA